MTETHTTNPITRFLETFNVKSDRIATEYVSYNKENDIFLHSNAETWGDSIRLSVETHSFPQTEILSLEGYDEEGLITELAELFASLNYNKDAFTKTVQEKYNDENEI